MFKKLALAAAMAAAYTGSAIAAPTYITNGGAAGVEAVVSDAGYFSPTFEAGRPGVAGSIGMRWMGVEYVDIDTQSSWYWFASPAPLVADSDVLSNPLGASTAGAGPFASTTWAIGGWSFAQTILASSSNKLAVTLTLTNNTGAKVSGAMWGVGFDPDQDGSGSNTTVNTILGSAGASAVSAVGPKSGYSVTLANDTSAAATAITAYIDTLCCSPVDPAVAFGGGPASSTGDQSISLAYRFGDIAENQSVSIGYSYTFALVPEPETYALMLAGLAAVGFVARRRRV